MIESLGSAEQVDEYVSSTAEYGSYMDILLAQYVTEKKINWGRFDLDAISYFINNGFSSEIIPTVIREIKKDFASILQFFYDYDVKVILVESPVYSNKYGIATAIDLVVDKLVMPLNEKTREQFSDSMNQLSRERAIINMKSGKKGFSIQHEIQLAGEYLLFNETYKNYNCSIQSVYNLSPSNWRKIPTYKLKNQTPVLEQSIKKFELCVTTATVHELFDFKQKTTIVFEGVTNLGESPNDNITFKPILDTVRLEAKKQTEIEDRVLSVL
jgi:hypothetical protein